MWCTSAPPASARRPETRWRFHLSRCPGFGVHLWGTKPEAFAADVERLERALEAFLTAVKDGRCVNNPFMGKLSSWQLLRWGYLHADHHLRQFGV